MRPSTRPRQTGFHANSRSVAGNTHNRYRLGADLCTQYYTVVMAQTVQTYAQNMTPQWWHSVWAQDRHWMNDENCIQTMTADRYMYIWFRTTGLWSVCTLFVASRVSHLRRAFRLTHPVMATNLHIWLRAWLWATINHYSDQHTSQCYCDSIKTKVYRLLTDFQSKIDSDSWGPDSIWYYLIELIN